MRQQQISRPGSRRSRRKPSFWQAHRKLSIGLIGVGSVSALAVMSIAVYEHRMAAEQIGVATRELPAVPAAATYANAGAKTAASAAAASRSNDIKRTDSASALATAVAVVAPAPETDTVATAATIPNDGVSSADASSGPSAGSGNITLASDSTAGLGTGPSAGGGGGGSFGGTPQVASNGPATNPVSFPSVTTPSGPSSPPTTPPVGPKLVNPQPAITPPTTPPPVVTQPPPGPKTAVTPPPPVAPSTPILTFPTPIIVLPTAPPPTVINAPNTPQVAQLAPTPGGTANNPIMPNNPSATGPNFLSIPKSANGWTYFDPIVAIGYNYQLQASNPGGPLTFGITDIRAVTTIGNGQYQLFLFDVLNSTYVNVGQTITAGANSDFNVVDYLETFTTAQDAEFGITDPNAGLTDFSLRGIDPSAGLDPNDPNAFITGLMFDGEINGFLAITPLELDTTTGADPDGTTRDVALPEPGTLGVFGLGLLGLAWLRRRRAA